MLNFHVNFRKTFLPFFAQEENDSSESFIVKTATELFNSACCLSLGDCQWSDLTLIKLPSLFKHFVLDADEIKLLLECYKALYPREEIELTSCVAHKFKSVVLGNEKFG